MKTTIAAMGLLFGLHWPDMGPAAAAEPVLSLDLCADQYLLALADPEDIAALTQFARMPHSYFRDAAPRYPVHHDRIEELIAVKAPLALRTTLGDPALDAALTRFGTRVLTVGPVENFDQAITRLRDVGRLIGREDRANLLADLTETRLATLRGQTGRRSPVDALYLVPGGTTTGAATFIAEVLKESGVINAAARRGREGWGSMALEEIVIEPPDIIITTFLEGRSETVRGWLPLDHPVMKRLYGAARTVELPSRYVACPAWIAIEAAFVINDELRRLPDAQNRADGF